MRILFLTDNFPPESNAPATRTYEHCVEWVKKGAEVTVITCNPNYPQGKLFRGYKNRFFKREEFIDGIRVIRVWTFISPNRGTVKRILDYLSFCFSAFFASLSVKTDIIVATSPQLFTAFAGYLTATVKRVKWVMEVRDLWPESIKAVEAMHDNFLLKLIDQIVIFLYRKADHIVVVTDSFKGRMIECGVKPATISIIKNGVHTTQFDVTTNTESLRRQLQLEGKFVVTYMGTLGMAHALDFIVDSVATIQHLPIHFLIMGEGATKIRLQRQVKRLGLSNVSILNGVPKTEVPRYILIGDVSLVNLRKTDTFKKVIPSKIFENAALRKPILLGVEGEAKQLVADYQAGVCFEPENSEDFLAKLDLLYTNKILYQSCQTGCDQLVKDFDRAELADSMYHVLDLIVNPISDDQEIALPNYSTEIAKSSESTTH